MLTVCCKIAIIYERHRCGPPMENPYCLSDVEPAAWEQIATVRENIHEQIQQQWLESATHDTNLSLDLPPPSDGVTKEEMREALKAAQLLRDPERSIVETLRDNQDPYRRRVRTIELDKGNHA